MEVRISLPTRSDYEIRQEGYMSQHLADRDSIFVKLAGTDQALSDSIGVLLVLGEKGLLDLKDPSIDLMIALLDVLRKSHFATSPTNTNVTTLGLQMPKRTKEVNMSERG